MSNYDSRSDAELLSSALAGDEPAFLALYERLKTPVYRYAFYMTNSKAAAEEVTQDVFIALLKHGDRYSESRGDVAGFVFGIARNLIRRITRGEQVYQPLPADEVLENLSQITGAEAESAPARMMQHEIVTTVQAAVASLPDHYRQVVVLCDLCELSYAEAAARLKCPVGTVRSRLNRGHALLLQKLKKPGKSRLPAAGTEECLI
jgi:RNA polymerase sigma-70 factor (ECF subfamily)